MVYIDSSSPFPAVAVSNAEAASVAMPQLNFVATAEDQTNYDKYFYFHRTETDFATAYADIVECDNYARDLASGVARSYGQGVLGDALANAVADAIYGSANRRRVRRSNLRACMHIKGYDRYGLSKRLFEAFNFHEGLSSVKDSDRTRMLMQQALVASGAKPQGKVLGL